MRSRGLVVVLLVAVLVGPPASASPDLDRADREETAMRLVSSAESSSLDWRAQYDYLDAFLDARVRVMRTESALETPRGSTPRSAGSCARAT